MPYTVWVFHFNFMKAASAVNYLYVHTDDGGAEALYLLPCVYPVTKCGEKSYTTVIV